MIIDTERQYIRHPTDMPIEFQAGESLQKIQIKDVAEGGLCFGSQYNIDAGEFIHIAISVCEPKFDAVGIVQWCKKEGKTFLVGVAFQKDSEIFAVRMVEQVCYIETYRQQMQGEHGIELSRDQAAVEWISKYAHTF